MDNYIETAAKVNGFKLVSTQKKIGLHLLPDKKET